MTVYPTRLQMGFAIGSVIVVALLVGFLPGIAVGKDPVRRGPTGDGETPGGQDPPVEPVAPKEAKAMSFEGPSKSDSTTPPSGGGGPGPAPRPETPGKPVRGREPPPSVSIQVEITIEASADVAAM